MSMFADYNTSTDGVAQSWQSLRFILTPLEGPNANKAIMLAGVRKLSGSGYAREGVTLVFDATGSGQASKTTKGRLKPNEVTLGLDPATWKNHWVPNVSDTSGGKNIARRFNLQVQAVDAAGNQTSSENYIGCIDTALDSDTPEDGSPHEKTAKLQPTRYVPPKAA